MICPQTKAECKSPVGCGAMGCSILEDDPPPKPSMARLVPEWNQGPPAASGDTPAEHRLARYDDLDSSTLTCSCGASITWTTDIHEIEEMRRFKECHSPPPHDMVEIHRLAGDVSMAMSALLAAVGKMERAAPKDSQPVSLDEIERLVDAFRVSVRDSERWQNPYCEIEESNVRAALMAAVRSLSNSTQDGE